MTDESDYEPRLTLAAKPVPDWEALAKARAEEVETLTLALEAMVEAGRHLQQRLMESEEQVGRLRDEIQRAVRREW